MASTYSAVISEVRRAEIKRLRAALGTAILFIPDANTHEPAAAAWWKEHGEVVREAATAMGTSHCLSPERTGEGKS